MIDVFVCVKPRPRYPGRRRSSIRDRQGCVSRGWNKEVIVESIGLVRVYHRSNPLHACTNFNRNNFHAHLLPPPPPTRMKNSKKIGLFDPIPCNKIYRGGSRGRLGSARSIIPSNWDQAMGRRRFRSILSSRQVYYSTPDTMLFFFLINLIRGKRMRGVI